jgi:tmRNA-binding protein
MMSVPTLPEPAWLKKLFLRLDALGEVSTLRGQLATERDRVRRLVLHREQLVKLAKSIKKERDEFEAIIIDRLSGKDTGKFKAL